jgi:hypothetical protein
MELSTPSHVTEPVLAKGQGRHSRNHDSTSDSSSPKSNDSVYRRITAIIGVHPNRSELTAIVNALGWVPLGRSEKRVKALLIQKLEGARDEILPILETTQGMQDLERAYLTVIARKKGDAGQMEDGGAISGLPPEATVKYYLNRPQSESWWGGNGNQTKVESGEAK